MTDSKPSVSVILQGEGQKIFFYKILEIVNIFSFDSHKSATMQALTVL